MRYIVLIISLFLLLPSCRKGEAPSSSSPSDSNSDVTKSPVEVRFTSGIRVDVNQTLGTRAPITGNVIPKDSTVGMIAIYADVNQASTNYNLEKLINKKAKAHELIQNAEYHVYDDNGSLSQKYIAEYPSGTSEYNGLAFYGYAPRSEKLYTLYTNKYSYYIPTYLDMEDMSKTPDYLYTGQFVVKTPDKTETVYLPFKHALGRIRFNITTDNIALGAKVKEIIVAADCDPNGKLFIEDGVCVTDYTYGDESFASEFVYKIDKEIGNGISADFMLYPGTKVFSIKCAIYTGDVITENDYYEIYPKPNQPEIVIQQGVYNTINVGFSPKEVQIGGNVSAWVEQGTDNVNIDQETGEVTHE